MARALGRRARPAPLRRGDARAPALLPRVPRVHAVRRVGPGPPAPGGVEEEGGAALRLRALAGNAVRLRLLLDPRD